MSDKSCLKIGHRGACGYAPENTLQSIQKALDCNVDMIEIDLFCCQSGEVVVFHDQRLERTTNGKGYLHRKTLEELKKLDAGNGEKIPTLKEVLDLVNRKTKINCELKGKKTLRPVIKIIEQYVREKGWKYDDFIISSYKRSKLRKIPKATHSKIPIGIIVTHYQLGFIQFAQKINAYSIHINRKLVNQCVINEAHQNNFKIFVWTVNDPKEIKELKEMGVDGIFSDFPDRI